MAEEDAATSEGRRNYRRAREIASQIVDLVEDDQIETYHARLTVLFLAAVELVGMEGMAYLRHALVNEHHRDWSASFDHGRFARSRRP